MNDREAMIARHKHSLEIMKIANTQYSSINQTIYNPFKKPYTSKKSLENLKPITISELRVDCTHYGKYLKCKISLPPVKISAIHLILEDDKKEIVRVAVYNYDIPPGYDLSTIFSIGRVVYILEPYYKIALDCMPIIRIDSPDEILFEDDIQKCKEKSLTELKNEGNICFQEGKYQEALDLYDQALHHKDLDKDMKLKCIMWSNHAAALIGLESYELALDSIKKALEIDPNYHKAHYRMAQALIELEKYEEVKEILDKLKGEIPKKELDPLISKFQEYMTNSKGNFDWKSIITSYFDNTSIHFTLGNYTNPNIKVTRSIQATGLGIIAMDNINKGELLVVEKAFAYVGYDEYNFLNDSSFYIIDDSFLNQKLLSIYSRDHYRRKELCKLYHGGESKNLDLNERIQLGYIIDKLDLESISRIKDLNSFNNMSFDMIFSNLLLNKYFVKPNGLWIYSSFFNHSCQPNADYFSINNIMIIRAIRDIPKDNEVFLSYLDANQSYKERQEKLKIYWCFECKCSRCTEEAKQTTDKNFKKLKKIVKNINHNNIQAKFQLPKLLEQFAICNNPYKIDLYPYLLRICRNCSLFNDSFQIMKSLDEDITKYGRLSAFWFMVFIQGFIDLTLSIGPGNDKTLEIREIAYKYYSFVFEQNREGFNVLIERIFKKALENLTEFRNMRESEK